MNIPFFALYFKHRKIRKIRRIIRGYQVLKSSGQLGLVRRVKREFGDTRIDEVTTAATDFIFGAGKEEAELITRQFLLLRNTGIALHNNLLYSIGSGNSRIVCPLPKAFRLVLIKNGFNVSQWRSSGIWACYIILLWCFGIVTVVKHFCNGLIRIASSGLVSTERYAYFTGLQSNNLPRPGKDGKSYDTVTWYSNWKGAGDNLAVFYHQCKGTPVCRLKSKKVSFRKEPFPAIRNVADLSWFFMWSTGAVILSAFDICRGRWWNAFLLAETTRAAVTRLAIPSELAVDYLFENSDSVFRPVWTYEAERKGSRIISYFYSSFEDFKLPGGYEPNSTYWQAMNWPLYAVWDHYQEQLIERNINKNANVIVVGPIWLSSSLVDLPEIPDSAVAVFDTPRLKMSSHFGFSTIAELYGNSAVPVTFIRDIASALEKYDGIIAHKGKRNRGLENLHKGYVRSIMKLVHQNRLLSIDADTSPIVVIEKCKAVISMPFTSTAILGRELGKPSIYYDPTGLIQKDDRGAHGILVISNESELQDWIGKVFNPV